MTSLVIRDVPVQFPFEPYEIQKRYMEKVIECLQTETNGILESPTGTGKTLSLLCSSLAWLTVKKAQIQAKQLSQASEDNMYIQALKEELDKKGGNANVSRSFLGVPTIIYTSRTHTQLMQAMQALKTTAYSHMKACALGSRDHLCIHPDVVKEPSNAKVQLCRAKLSTRSCHLHNRVEKLKSDKIINDADILDIEDLVKLGEKHKFCPYYMSIELKQQVDIIFMPYNYLLDPHIRKSLGIQLYNNVIILDEAHNIERTCEESASLQIKSTDITLCIEEVTQVMKAVSEEPLSFTDNNVPKDFTADELCILKQMLLDFENAFDEIELKQGPEGTTFDGGFIFDLLTKANIREENSNAIIQLLEKIVQFLNTAQQGPFVRRGNALELFKNMLTIVFMDFGSEFKDKINKCFKVHIAAEEVKKKISTDWLSKAAATFSKSVCRVLNFWCFNPGFGMNMMTAKGVKCVILTSGTLAPLKPLISELGIKVGVQLENPHIVKGDQICVKILTTGPDSEKLNCNYQNRNNPKYISSLGRTVINLCRIIPDGLLIFFPSYPVLQKCQTQWQEDGIWSTICQVKPIFVEPKEKGAFNSAMNDYYSRIQDPTLKGAIFMGVCRGKVSEGLDFADVNGRAVLIIGLPYPPLKDPRVMLKKRYLDICNANDKEYLRGDEWYSLEAVRAVNQAVGRIIRHQHDYGAIILMDERFTYSKIQSQLSLWLRNHIKVIPNFGVIIRDVKTFFNNAREKLPVITLKAQIPPSTVSASFDTVQAYKKGNFNFGTSSTCNFSSSNDSSVGLVSIHKRRDQISPVSSLPKRKKIVLVPQASDDSRSVPETDIKEYIVMVKKRLNSQKFKDFVSAITNYRNSSNFDDLISELDKIFITDYTNRFLLQGLIPYVKQKDKEMYEAYWNKMR